MRMIYAVLAVALMAGPCLAQGTYDELLAENTRLKEEVKQLRHKLARAELEIAGLKTRLDKSEGLAAAEAPKASHIGTVTQNKAVDTKELRDKRSRNISQTKQLINEYNEARKAYNYMQRYDYRDKYSDRDMYDAKRKMESLDRKVKAMRLQTRQLDADIAKAASERLITARLEDGAVAELLPRGVSVATLNGMRVGVKYRIDGNLVRGKIHVKAISEIVDEPAGATSSQVREAVNQGSVGAGAGQ